MFHPLALFVGLRYTRAKRRGHFISFISLASVIGIALGVLVLITVLSVMNGFDHEIRDRIFGLAQQVSVSSHTKAGLSDWRSLSDTLLKEDKVLAVAPFINSQAMLTANNASQPLILSGIDPTQEARVSDMPKMMVEGKLTDLTPGRFGIAIGQDLAFNLGLAVGDKVNILIPDASVTPIGVLPRMKRFTITSLFHVEGNANFDSSYAFIHLNDAQKLHKLGDRVWGLRLKVPDLYDAPFVARDLWQKYRTQPYSFSDWTQQYGDLSRAIRMEKTMMFIILTLIIAVAAFNLVASLVMVVNDKRSEIAILRTLGASPAMIRNMFMVQGTLITLLGTLVGTIFGVLLALNVTPIVDGLQKLLSTQFISANVYFGVDHLPSKVEWSEVVLIAMIALLLGLLGTIYPARQAAKTEPAEALRYE